MPNSVATKTQLKRAANGFQPKEERQLRDRWIRVRVTNQEFASFHSCADQFGTTLSTLLRQLVEHASAQLLGRGPR